MTNDLHKTLKKVDGTILFFFLLWCEGETRSGNIGEKSGTKEAKNELEMAFSPASHTT